jgi:hypothetical protein
MRFANRHLAISFAAREQKRQAMSFDLPTLSEIVIDQPC